MYILKIKYGFFLLVPSWGEHSLFAGRETSSSINTTEQLRICSYIICYWFTLGLFTKWVQTCKYKQQENLWLDSQSILTPKNIIDIIGVSRQCTTSNYMLLLKCISKNEAVVIFMCFSSRNMSFSHEAMEDRGFQNHNF